MGGIWSETKTWEEPIGKSRSFCPHCGKNTLWIKYQILEQTFDYSVIPCSGKTPLGEYFQCKECGARYRSLPK